ncbi:sugar phosphate isomerase/epimerase family protein [Virgibacillus sp. DJP39]|uniref:sugar phosphate isomerase/epimerase family protein n=1 Tax=Virgibacillus sp. DJP39 TaxID=3409790 RepID=UPI003BB5DAF5
MRGIGLQLYSVREATEKDFLGTVRKVADLGYEAVQFAGFFGKSARQVKQVMDEKNIRVAGSHTSLDLLRGDKLKETILYNQEIDNNLIICPYLPEEKRESIDSYRRTAEELNSIGHVCNENGMVFAYHNHNFEFETFDGSTGFDLLFENTDPKVVKIELDCFWVIHAGYSPAAIMNKYGNRVVSLHMKDMKEIEGRKRSIEIGKGILDMNSLLATAKEHHVDWLVVEQEDFDLEPMESAKINLDNLKELLN